MRNLEMAARIEAAAAPADGGVAGRVVQAFADPASSRLEFGTPWP